MLRSCWSQDYDKPEYIADPDATKPEDWDDDTDGEWEPPMITNPEFKVPLNLLLIMTYCVLLTGRVEA